MILAFSSSVAAAPVVRKIVAIGAPSHAAIVMAALVAAIHAFLAAEKTWMAGTSLALTAGDKPDHDDDESHRP
jgi:hypothetical protein